VALFGTYNYYHEVGLSTAQNMGEVNLTNTVIESDITLTRGTNTDKIFVFFCMG
jgi:hypothetical protein